MVWTQADLHPNFHGWTVSLHWLCPVGHLLCLPYSPLERCWATQLSRCSGQAFWLGGARSYTQQSAGYDWVGGGTGPGSRAGKALHLRTSNQADLHPAKFPGQTGSADEQSCWLGPLLGAVGKNLVCHDLSAGRYILTPSPSRSDSQRSSAADSSTIPVM